MPNQFLTSYTEITFLEKIRDNLRHCRSFDFSVSFIKKAGLVLLYKDIEAAVNGYASTWEPKISRIEVGDKHG